MRSPEGGMLDGYHDTPRLALLGLIDDRWAPTQVLDIGCGTGATLAALKRRFPAARTTGLERLPAAAQVARDAGHGDALIEADVLDAGAVNFAPASFDLVILSHVLEHFAEPAAVLARVRDWLAPDARLLVALPNIRHLSALLPLLLRGEFAYGDAGILDRTHLRFFTRKSAERFFAEQGFIVEAAAADINGPKSTLLHRASLGLARDFAAFAWNFRLRVR
jgi:O-antigen biosynthesis protein